MQIKMNGHKIKNFCVQKKTARVIGVFLQNDPLVIYCTIELARSYHRKWTILKKKTTFPITMQFLFSK